jgi:hypothetical protein
VLNILAYDVTDIRYLLWHQIGLKLGSLIDIIDSYFVVLDQPEHVLKLELQIELFSALIKER